MTETTTLPTLRRPGRPRKFGTIQEHAEPVVEQATEAQEATPVVEQPQPIQYAIAKLTPHMLAGEIHRLYEEGEDLAPVHQVSNAIQISKGVSVAAQAQPDHELKAAVEAAKTSAEKPRTFAIAYRNNRNALKVAHGVEYQDGQVEVENGHGIVSGWEDSMVDLKETLVKHDRPHHIDYTDEP